MAKLINRYKKWCQRGRLDRVGLCPELKDTPYYRKLLLFEPKGDDLKKLVKDGESPGYWASGLPITDSRRIRTFTPLRATIVCFIMAMHREI